MLATAALLDPEPFDPATRPRALAHAALSSMAGYGVPPTPDNYRIWYAYHAGDDVMLGRVLDAYLGSRKPLTRALLAELHARFFGPHPAEETLGETAAKLSEAVQGLRALAGGAERETGTFAAELRALATEVVREGGEAPAWLGRVVEEAARMAQRTAALRAAYAGSLAAIEEMRAALATASAEAMTDPLTGLGNRRAFDAAFRRTLARAARGEGPLCLALVDVDRFKALNDRWGHPVGDAVLARVARVLDEAAPPAARCMRFGGEEFALLMPGYALDAAIPALDELRLAVRGTAFQLRSTGESMGTLTVSIGAARLMNDEAGADLLARADAALYRAKRAGRDRVEADPPG